MFQNFLAKSLRFILATKNKNKNKIYNLFHFFIFFEQIFFKYELEKDFSCSSTNFDNDLLFCFLCNAKI